MRIVQVANFYSGRSSGLRTVVDHLGMGYAARGVDRVLVVPRRQDRVLETRHGRVVGIRSPRTPNGDYVFARRKELRRIVLSMRPDRIEVSDPITAHWLDDIAHRAQIPLLLIAHERLESSLSSQLPSWVSSTAAADRITRRLHGRADVVVTASRFAAADWDLPPHLLRVIPFGVDLETFRPAPRREVRRSPLLACVSRLAPDKEVHLAIDALRHVRRSGQNAGLIIIGDGPSEKDLIRYADGLPVRFFGALRDPHSVAHLVGQADVFIAPAQGDSFGLAALEALACGTPVVAPAGGAVSEFLTPDAGALGTARVLGPATEAVLARDQQAMRAAARAVAQTRPWSTAVTAMLAAHGVPTIVRIAS